ncbi:hypothetical protein QE152_g7782 [Popillia japonica]|uniref:Uncharacterized protein n=1 Tax=Popillia japonica TaxID=7064 RepID=A0AAW1MDU7_POPJA
MEKVRNGFFAYHAELAEAYYYMHEKYTNNEMCCLQEIEAYFQYLRGYSVTRKRSPYKEIFKTGLLKIDEYGLKLRHYNLWYLKPICHIKGYNVGSVGLIECRMAFLLLIYGTFISMVFLLIERLIRYTQSKCK